MENGTIPSLRANSEIDQVIFSRLLSDGTYDYTYDMEGSPLTKTRISDGEVTEYTWDHRKRLTDVVVKDEEDTILKVVHYTYDVHDRRIGKWVDADGEGAGEHTELWTAYDGDNPYADFDAEGSLTTRYLYGPAIDQLFARIHSGADIDWYLTDHLGSVRQIVDSQDNVIDELAYDSFGQLLSETAPSAGDRFKYTSREWDAETGQYYYRARYYGPDVGRFITQDPLGFKAGDANLYRYVDNGPTNFTDPTGLTKGGPQNIRPSELTGNETPAQVQALIDRLKNEDPKRWAKRIAKLRGWLKVLKRGGAFGIAITALLAIPTIVEGCQQNGVQGGVQAAGGVIFDIVVATGISTVVGVGITSATTVTVGGTAVTGIVGATGVGGAVVITFTAGYAVGDAIGHIQVGGQSIHDHIADGIIAGLDFFGLW